MTTTIVPEPAPAPAPHGSATEGADPAAGGAVAVRRGDRAAGRCSTRSSSWTRARWPATR